MPRIPVSMFGVNRLRISPLIVYDVGMYSKVVVLFVSMVLGVFLAPSLVQGYEPGACCGCGKKWGEGTGCSVNDSSCTVGCTPPTPTIPPNPPATSTPPPGSTPVPTTPPGAPTNTPPPGTTVTPEPTNACTVNCSGQVCGEDPGSSCSTNADCAGGYTCNGNGKCQRCTTPGVACCGYCVPQGWGCSGPDCAMTKKWVCPK